MHIFSKKQQQKKQETPEVIYCLKLYITVENNDPNS